ncbi:hypothetical protein KC726_03435 [Candidatus Woesebacteria bacterium]|nr:hypothetical protein [Candidatus Woesebacteria bacterium]
MKEADQRTTALEQGLEALRIPNIFKLSRAAVFSRFQSMSQSLSPFAPVSFADAVQTIGAVMEVLDGEIDHLEEQSRGLRVLDLGCGSPEEGWYPWLSVGLGSCGSEVVGIDIGKQYEETESYYTHVQFDLLNLLEEGGQDRFIAQLPDGYRQFDVLTVTNLFSSGTSGALKNIARESNMQYYQLPNAIGILARKILVQGGLLVIETFSDRRLVLMKYEDDLFFLTKDEELDREHWSTAEEPFNFEDF